jgi:hypothetical protein
MKYVKRAGIGIICCLVIAGTSLLAQNQSDEIELTRTIIQAERQIILAANMGLTDEEGQRFWPLYRQYRGDLAKNGDRMVTLITTFADNYENLSEGTAEWMIKEFLAIEKVEAEVTARWVPRFREVLSAKKLVLFLQLENKMDAIIDYELAESIPLIR